MSNKPNASIQMIADYEGDVKTLFENNVNGEIPILATRNLVLFPGVITPILIGRPASVSLINRIKNNPDTIFAIFCQKNPDLDDPEKKDLYEYGVYAKLVKIIEMPGPDNNITAIIQGLGRCNLVDITKRKPFISGITETAPEILPALNDKEFKTAIDDLRNTTSEYIKKNDDIPDESYFALNNIQNDVIVADFICTNMPFGISDKIKMLKANCTVRIKRLLD